MSTQNYKVLHITTHCGGGVGDTMFGYFSENKTSEHEVVILGYALDKVINRAKELNIPLHMNKTHQEILQMIPNFDIILIHIWNHPLIYDFLVRNELPDCRVIMWGHNSGFDAPNIYPKKALTYPDLFVFTTPLSYELGGVKELPREKFYDIWSTNNFDEYKVIKVNKHKGFNIGYVGTVDYAKMHPDFLQMCKEINIPNVKFIVVGGTKEKEIEAEVKAMGMEDKFIFPGFVPDLPRYYEMFDVFGYPLASYHYGTCDLVLQIAMISGVVPIVFNNPMENFMVKDKKTGFIVKNKKEYIQAIMNMYNNVNWRKEMSDNTRKEASVRFSLQTLESEWRKTFTKVLEFPKTVKKWDINKNEITAKDVFLESLGDYGGAFKYHCNRHSFSDLIFSNKAVQKLAKSPSWQTETKGTVHNYHAYFPEDKYLKLWSELMKST